MVLSAFVVFYFFRAVSINDLCSIGAQIWIEINVSTITFVFYYYFCNPSSYWLLYIGVSAYYCGLYLQEAQARQSCYFSRLIQTHRLVLFFYFDLCILILTFYVLWCDQNDFLSDGMTHFKDTFFLPLYSYSNLHTHTLFITFIQAHSTRNACSTSNSGWKVCHHKTKH